MLADMNTPLQNELSRREALKLIGTGVALAGLGLPSRGLAAEASVPTWQLPPLGYAYAALEPHIDARTMEIHHTKHHQAFLSNLTKLLEPHPELRALGPEALMKNLNRVPEAIRLGVRNNVGGHLNHAFFWRILTPAPAAALSASSALSLALTKTFGADHSEFKKQFTAAAMGRFGSGWAWLSAKSDGSLLIHSTPNQDSPLSEGLTPIIGLDVWEHAYYLHYQNRRADYVNAFWNVLNWSQAEASYAAVRKA
jgi:superoxide dismutase, Fe-Mn family